MSPRPGIRLNGTTVEFRTRALIEQSIATQQVCGENYRAPLWRAASSGALAIAAVVGGGLVPGRILKQRRPLAIILQDDHPEATGLEAWPQAHRLVRWARAVVIHAAAGLPQHYALFAQATVSHGRVLIIECELRHLPTWRDLVLQERLPGEILVIAPPPGADHPIGAAQAGEVLQ